MLMAQIPTPLPVNRGGTGSATAAGARTNLGLVIGTNVQAYSAVLASLSGLNPMAVGGVPYSSGAAAFSLLPAAAVGRVLTSAGVATAPAWSTNYLDGSLCTVLQGGAVFGRYTTLSAALAAIVDAAANKEYHILVTGAIAETDTVTAKSHVHVTGLAGATVTVTKTGAGHGISLASLTNTVWRGLTIKRAGALTVNTVHAVSISGTSDSTVRLEGIFGQNVTTNGGGGTSCHGLLISDSAAPTLVDCVFTGGAGTGGYCYGVSVTTSGRAEFYNCRFYGGSGAGAGMGGVLGGGAPIIAIGCRFMGGSGGSSSYGLQDFGAAILRDCHITGGSGGSDESGYYADGNCTSQLIGCSCKSGTGANSHGAATRKSSRPELVNCALIGGDSATGNNGISVADASAPVLRGCKNVLPAVQVEKIATATTTWELSASKPLQLASLSINVTAAGDAGATVDIGTTLAGNDVVAAQAIDTTGQKYVTLGAGALPILAAAGVLYITINGTGTPSLTISGTAIVSFGTCYAAFLNSTGAVKLHSCTLTSNAASTCVSISAGAITANKLEIANCVFVARPKDASSSKAVVCDAAYNPAPVYQCVLGGGSTNLVCAAGTANGTSTEF